MVSLLVVFLCIFFFKQKTAYEMRISDWSSDVCSSDLDVPAFSGGRSMQILLADFDNDGDLDPFLLDGPKFSNSTQGLLYRNNGSGGFTDVSVGSEIGRASCRERVCQYV